jgi:hypothetical protein
MPPDRLRITMPRTLLPRPLAVIVMGVCLAALVLGVRAMVVGDHACCLCRSAQITNVPDAIRGDFPRPCPANVVCVP